MNLELGEDYLKQRLTCYNRSKLFHNHSHVVNDYFPTRSGVVSLLLFTIKCVVNVHGTIP